MFLLTLEVMPIRPLINKLNKNTNKGGKEMEAEPPSFYLKLAFSCIALFLLLLSFISSWKTKENNDVCVFAPLSLSFSNRFSTSSGKKTKQVKMRDSNERALRRLVTKDNAHIASSSFYGLVGEMGIRKNRAASSWTQ